MPLEHSVGPFAKFVNRKIAQICAYLCYFCDKNVTNTMKLSIHLKPKSTGEYYVFISLSHQSKRVLISTPYIIGAESVKDGKITNKAKYAEIYNKELLRYEERLGYIVAPELLDLATIKEIITNTRKEDVTVVEFFSAAEEHVKKIAQNPARKGTARVYLCDLKVFQKYIGRSKLYTFEMTRKIMQDYIKHMQDSGCKPSTIQNKMGTLKTLFYAVRDEYNDYDTGVLNVKNDPFRKLELPQVLISPGDKALSVDDLREIINIRLQKRAGYNINVLSRALDYFLLSFYLLGINPIDMYNLQIGQYKDGRIVYSRSKTKRRAGGSEISIPVCAQAEEIINRHRGKGEMLLDMQEHYGTANAVVSMVSRNLFTLYEMLDLQIDKDNFTWYSARHTWASIAANDCHFSDAEVARALNHQSEHKVTRGYIRPDWSLLDRMNEAVLAVVFEKKAETDESAPA